MSQSRIGVTGLAVMGQNLARNLARHGIPVVVHNRTAARTEELVARHGGEGPMTPAYSLEELAAALPRPRRVLLMVKAGKPVDAVIAELLPHLEPGDILIDGGNSWYEDTRRRGAELARHGIRFIGAGISGGEEGALHGPSIMPGGPEDAYREVEEALTTIAARVGGVPCCAYIGPDGAGHYVKTVHNGIEYAVMQAIGEAYDLLRSVLGLAPAELAGALATAPGGGSSFLLEITAEVLRKTDEASGRPLVDVILDEAEQKGTGRWSVQSALELGVPVPAIAEAVQARSLSADREARLEAARILPGPAPAGGGDGDLVEAVRTALHAATLVAYAQGFQLMAAASEHHGWKLDLGTIATIWRGGCIIRASFLDQVREAFARQPGLRNLLLAPAFRDAMAGAQGAWRRTVAVAAAAGVPTPVLSSALAWYDGYRRERTPASLIQGMRDYFGAHTYRRLDRPGSFHTRWAQDGKEVEA